MGLSNNIIRASALAVGLGSSTSGCLVEFPTGRNPSCCTDAEVDAGVPDLGVDAKPDLSLPEGCEMVEVEALCSQIGARAMLGPDHNCCPTGFEEVSECEDQKDCHCCVPNGEIPVTANDSGASDSGELPDGRVVSPVDGGPTPHDAGTANPQDGAPTPEDASRPDAVHRDVYVPGDAVPTPSDSAGLPQDAAPAQQDGAPLPPDAEVCGNNQIVEGNSFMRCGDGGVADVGPALNPDAAVTPLDATMIDAVSVDAAAIPDAMSLDAANITPDQGVPVDSGVADIHDTEVTMDRPLPLDPEICFDLNNIDEDQNGLSGCEDPACANHEAATIRFTGNLADLYTTNNPEARLLSAIAINESLTCANIVNREGLLFSIRGDGGIFDISVDMRTGVSRLLRRPGLVIWRSNNGELPGNPPEAEPIFAGGIGEGFHGNNQNITGMFPDPR